MRKLPVTTRLDAFEVKPVARQPLFSLYDQTIRTLQREKGADSLKNFFAIPNISKSIQEVQWLTLATGPIRRWADLDPQEQLRAGEQIKENCKLIHEICQRLIKAQGVDSPTVEALQNMQVTPDLQNSLCMVGDQVVLTQWGCRPFGTPPTDFNLEGQGKELVQKIRKPVTPPPAEIISTPESTPPTSVPPEPVPPDPIPPEPTPPMPTPPDPTPPEPIPPEPQVDAPAKKRPVLWRWLVLLLLLLLLLLGLFLKKWTYLAPYDFAAEERHRAEITDLWNKIDEKSKACAAVPEPKPVEPPPPPNLNSDAMERGDLNVFNGTWRLITELFNVRTKEKIIIEMSFGSAGTGTATITEAQGGVCQGAATLEIRSANKFDVTTSELACKHVNSSYNPNFVQCQVKPDRKTADCVLQCESGKCDATFQRR